MTNTVVVSRSALLAIALLSLCACEGQSSPVAGAYDATTGDVSPNGDGKADEGTEGNDGALTSDGGATEPPDTDASGTDTTSAVDLGTYRCGDPPITVKCQELAEDDVLCKMPDGKPFSRFYGTEFEGSCTPAN